MLTEADKRLIDVLIPTGMDLTDMAGVLDVMEEAGQTEWLTDWIKENKPTSYQQVMFVVGQLVEKYLL